MYRLYFCMTGSTVDLFTLASSQTCNMLCYDIITAIMSLGNGKFSDPL